MVRIKRVVLLMVVLVSPVLMGLFLLWGIDKTVHAVSTNTLTVTNVYDSGIGSLRQAIQDSNDGDTIIFNTNGIIELNQELVVDKSLSIQGNRQITISGGGQVRVFHVMTRTNSQNVAVTLDRLSIVDGKFIIESPDMIDCDLYISCGGGIFIQDSGVALTVTNSTISGNSTDDYGGGIYNKGGVLIIDNSIISDNSTNFSSSAGGGIYNKNGHMLVSNSRILGNSSYSGGGAGIYNDTGTLSVSRTTFSENRASWGDGAGINNSKGSLSVEDSTVNDNWTHAYGGGIYNGDGTATIINSTISSNIVTFEDGAGIYNRKGELIIRNSTLSGNRAISGRGGGVYSDGGTIEVINSTLSGNLAYFNGGGIFNKGGALTVSHSTLTQNLIGTSVVNGEQQGLNGGGIASQGSVTTSTTLSNSLVSGNIINSAGSPSTMPDNLALFEGNNNSFISYGNNLIGIISDTINIFITTGDISNTLPFLGPLENNGGQTLTHVPLENSAAINAGNCSNGPVTDQRGFSRPQDHTCDIGSIERGTYNFLPIITR